MQYFYNSSPLWFYTVVLLALIPAGIYGIKDSERRQPGHPFKYNMYSVFLISAVMIIKRYIDEFSENPILLKVGDIAIAVLVIIVIAVLGITTYFAYKRNYISEQAKYTLRTSVLPLLGVAAIGIGVIIYSVYFWKE